MLSAYLLSQQDVARAGIAKLWLRKALRQAPAAILTGLIHAQARSKARAVLGGLQELRGLHVCVRLSRMFSGPSWQFNFKTRSPVSLIMVHYIDVFKGSVHFQKLLSALIANRGDCK